MPFLACLSSTEIFLRKTFNTQKVKISVPGYVYLQQMVKSLQLPSKRLAEKHHGDYNHQPPTTTSNHHLQPPPPNTTTKHHLQPLPPITK